jgi:hypothetical protein
MIRSTGRAVRRRRCRVALDLVERLLQLRQEVVVATQDGRPLPAHRAAQHLLEARAVGPEGAHPGEVAVRKTCPSAMNAPLMPPALVPAITSARAVARTSLAG